MLVVEPFDPARDATALVELLCADEWPFHGCRRPTEAIARRWIESDRFQAAGSARSAWVLVDGARAGFVSLQELEDPTPVFDLRVASLRRRRGVGRRALAWAVEETFRVERRPRLEAHTRADNAPMRALLRSAPGWVQEAHHRCAWPDDADRLHDAVTYALLRQDWERGTRTPVPLLEP